MGSGLPLAAVQRALYGVLVGDHTLVGLLAKSPSGGPGISDQPQPNAAYPRIEVGGFTANPPAQTMGPVGSRKACWEITGQIKALSTYAGEAQGQTILTRLAALLHYPASALSVTGYADVECRLAIEPSYTELVNNVVVRHFPAIVRVTLYES
jgi:hypothetical protein